MSTPQPLSATDTRTMYSQVNQLLLAQKDALAAEQIQLHLTSFNPIAKNSESYRLACCAVENNCKKAVSVLLSQSSTWIQNDRQTLAPLLERAIEQHNVEIAELLIEKMDRPSAGMGTALVECALLEKAVLDACSAGMESTVCALLEKGVNPNVRDENGTVLLLACLKQQMDQAFSCALKQGADANARVSKSQRPLIMELINQGAEDKALELLEFSADPNTVDDDRDPLLRYAIQEGMVKLFHAALAKGSNPNVTCNGSSARALIMEFIGSGHEDSALALLEAGADPNTVDDDGDPLLRYAIQEKMPDLFEAALKKGANPNCNCAGKNPRPVIMELIEMGNEEYASALLNAGANPDTIDDDGDPLLRYALQEKMPILFKTAIEKGADPNVLCTGIPPRPLIMHCIEYFDESSALVLLNAGADPNTLDGDGDPLLRFALQKRMPLLFKAALEKGAHPNALCAGKPKRPLIMSLIEYFDESYALDLLNAGADPNTRDADDDPLLRYALQKKMPRLFRAALAKGADPNGVCSGASRRPLIMNVIENFNESHVLDLLDAGADPNALDEDGDPLLRFACQKGMLNVFKRALEKGAHPNSLYNEEPLIFYAIDKNQPDFVLELVKQMAFPDVKNSVGQTVLAEVVKKRWGPVFEALIQAGANPNVEIDGVPLAFTLLDEPDPCFLEALLNSEQLDEQLLDRLKKRSGRHAARVSEVCTERETMVFKKRKLLL